MQTKEVKSNLMKCRNVGLAQQLIAKINIQYHKLNIKRMHYSKI